MSNETFHGTTILALRTEGAVVMAGDGQVTLGNIVTKHRAKKVRRIFHDKIITGFAGTTADALTLSEKLEGKLEQYNGNLTRAARMLGVAKSTLHYKLKRLGIRRDGIVATARAEEPSVFNVPAQDTGPRTPPP